MFAKIVMYCLLLLSANVLLVIVLTLHYDNVIHEKDLGLVLQIGISMEMAAILLFLIWYLGKYSTHSLKLLRY